MSGTKKWMSEQSAALLENIRNGSIPKDPKGPIDCLPYLTGVFSDVSNRTFYNKYKPAVLRFSEPVALGTSSAASRGNASSGGGGSGGSGRASASGHATGAQRAEETSDTGHAMAADVSGYPHMAIIMMQGNGLWKAVVKVLVPREVQLDKAVIAHPGTLLELTFNWPAAALAWGSQDTAEAFQFEQALFQLKVDQFGRVSTKAPQFTFTHYFGFALDEDSIVVVEEGLPDSSMKTVKCTCSSLRKIDFSNKKARTF